MSRPGGQKIVVPKELTNILVDFTVSVLINEPSDIIEFASQYFNQLAVERKSGGGSTSSGGNSRDHNHHLDDENEDSAEFSK